MLQLEPILEEDSPDESPGRDGEIALVEGHERDHEPLGRARHGLVAGHLPLHGGGEWVTSVTSAEMSVLSYGHPWAHYSGGYQDRLLDRPLGLLDLCYMTPDGVEHKDYGGGVLG
jgi:hypothetical protein